MTFTVHVYDTEDISSEQPLLSYVLGMNTIIGRTSESHIVLPCVEHSVSRKHAVILQHEGRYFLHDCSTNGTFINESEEPIGHESMVELKSGDRFHIGRYELIVEANEVAQKSGSRPGKLEKKSTHASRSNSHHHHKQVEDDFSDPQDRALSAVSHSVIPAVESLSFSQPFNLMKTQQANTSIDHSSVIQGRTRAPIDADLQESFVPPVADIPVDWLRKDPAWQMGNDSVEAHDACDQTTDVLIELPVQMGTTVPVKSEVPAKSEALLSESHASERSPQTEFMPPLDSLAGKAQKNVSETFSPAANGALFDALLAGLSIQPELVTQPMTSDTLRRLGAVVRMLIETQLQLRQLKMVWMNRLSSDSIPIPQLLEAESLADYADVTAAIQALIDPAQAGYTKTLHQFSAAQTEIVADLKVIFDTSEQITAALISASIPDALENAFQQHEAEEDVIRSVTQRFLARRTRDHRRWQYFRTQWQSVCHKAIRKVKLQFETYVLTTLTIRSRQRKNGK